MGYAKAVSGRDFWKNKLQFLAKRVKLQSHRTFIVPTGFGFAFGGISFVLLIMAIGYANNLLYFFVFLLISMALTGMMTTNKNVDSVEVANLTVESLYAGEENQLTLTVRNLNLKSHLWSLEFKLSDPQEKGELLTVDEIHFEKTLSLPWTPGARGLRRLPRVLIQSQFPFKMLRAWRYFDQKSEFYIYPQRKGIERIPERRGKKSDDEMDAEAHDQGLFRDFREFQKSDPPQRIDWKRSLKHQKHLVKNFETSGEKKVTLTWDLTSFISDFEDRISQLSLWIDLCHKKNELYSLSLKNFSTEFSCSSHHRQACLQKLALLTPEDFA